MRIQTKIKPTCLINGLIFFSLNVTDAWLTKELIVAGGGEANPIVSAYSCNLWIKGLVALALVLILARFGRARVLKVLNICMVAVVLWTGGWLLSYLA